MQNGRLKRRRQRRRFQAFARPIGRGARCPGATPASARARAEALRLAVAATPVPLEGASLAVIVSIGVALRGGEPALAPVLRAADQAMYAAKHAGRNRVVLAD